MQEHKTEDLLGMMERLRRLQKLMQSTESTKSTESTEIPKVSQTFTPSTPQTSMPQTSMSQTSMPQTSMSQTPMPQDAQCRENMILAAIPFLDWAYQKDLYVVVRLMQMRRMCEGGLLEARSKEEAPHIRRQKMLEAILPCLPKQEQQQLDFICRMMRAKYILEQREDLHAGMGKTGNTSLGGRKDTFVTGSGGKKPG